MFCNEPNKNYIETEMPKQPFARLGIWNRLRYNAALLNRNHPIATKLTALFFLLLNVCLLASIPSLPPHFLFGWGMPIFASVGGLAAAQ